MPRHRTLLILLLLLGLALRLGWSLSRPTDEAHLAELPDQREYLTVARNILDGRGMVLYDERFDDTVYAYRMPGYPLFLAACGGSATIARIAQALIDTSSALAVFLIARRFVAGSSALVALALVALNPYLIYFSATLLSETLFTALLAWGMLLMLSPRRLGYASGVALLLASIYVRPGAVALPVLIAIGAELVRDVRVGSRSFWRVPAGALMIALSVLALLPWAMRNHERLGAWVFTTTNGGVTLWDGFNDRATGGSDQSQLARMPELRRMGELRRHEYLGAMAIQWAMEHPQRSAWLVGQKLARLWSPVPLSETYGSKRSYVAVGLVFALPLFVLALIGVTLAPLNRSIKLYLLLPALYFTAVHAVTVGSLRYRIPADVPMSILAAAGAARVARRVLPRQQVVDERTVADPDRNAV